MWIFILLLFLIFAGLWLQWRKKQLSVFEEVGIPGPKPNIFFGNLLEMLKKTPLKCQEQWIKKYGKVVGYYYGTTSTIMVTDTDMIKQIFIKDFHRFSNRSITFASIPISKPAGPLVAGITQLRDKKRWKEVRSIITPSFTTSKIKTMAPIMSNAVDSLLNAIEKNSKSRESFDIYELYKRLTMDVIGRTAFGIQTDVQNNPNDLMLQAVKGFFGNEFNSIFNILRASFPEFGEIWMLVLKVLFTIKGKGRNFITEIYDQVKQIVYNRRKNEKYRRQDLLQIIMDAKISEAEFNSITNEELATENLGKEDKKKRNDFKNDVTKLFLRMSDKEIADNSVIFFLAGFETTSSSLAYTTHCLIHNPDIQEKLRKEIHEITKNGGTLDYNSIQQLKYLEQVIMESLRLYPPVHSFVNRVAEEDIQYGQYLIKKGITVQIPIFNLNRDPDVWQDPEKFDPSRFSQANKGNINAMGFQTFGVGPRNCVGLRFAKLEMKLALANILNKYELIRTKESDQDPISLKIYPVMLNPAKGIYLKAIPIE